MIKRFHWKPTAWERNLAFSNSLHNIIRNRIALNWKALSASLEDGQLVYSMQGEGVSQQGGPIVVNFVNFPIKKATWENLSVLPPLLLIPCTALDYENAVNTQISKLHQGRTEPLKITQCKQEGLVLRLISYKSVNHKLHLINGP